MLILILFLLQSITATQQGFFNAMVYGWTHGDFLNVLAIPNPRRYSCLHKSMDSAEASMAEDQGDSRSAVAGSREDSEYETDGEEFSKTL